MFLNRSSPLLRVVAAPTTISRACYSVGVHPNRIAEQQELLNERIRIAAHRQETTVRDLLVLYDRENRRMGSVNVSSMLVNLAHLAHRRGQLPTARHERFFDHLSRRAFDLLPEMSPASVADVTLSFSVLAVTEHDILQRLWEQVLPKMEATVAAGADGGADGGVVGQGDHFGPKDLSKLADGVVNFHHLVTSEGVSGSVHTNPLFLPATPSAAPVVPLERLLPLLSSAAVANVSSFTPQQLVNICRCVAQLGGTQTQTQTQKQQQQQKALFEAVEGAAVSKIFRFSPRQMEDLVWCFNRAQRPSPTLLQAVTHQAALLRITLDNLATH